MVRQGLARLGLSVEEGYVAEWCGKSPRVGASIGNAMPKQVAMVLGKVRFLPPPITKTIRR